ncbi:alpha-ketoacid dehydrogenase subunit beta [Dictyobacter aurantiacus]|uniref:2-oxoisovalerate dehydrogenase subunit beta n=1 Tax=Dictyobacter aurantiacus TaxID=1936993 RepID=A0A401ZI27_9CHLR|nr:alpha-ketoacid dehydrogenase subunit beta [Dictyobacter aurantiacus]GCE06496.1 2-oxoisovalerate dehydrogenase subunit beta [Dictyobacter aurantiacus]
MTQRNLIEAINDALNVAMGEDERVMVMGEDVGRNGGVFRATDGLIERYGEERVVDTPLAEAGIVGTAIGLATYGLLPIAEIQFLGFSMQSFAQLLLQAARIRARSRGRFTCPLVVRAPFGGGVRAFELHGDALEAHFVHAPGLKVVAPATPYDAKGMLLAAINDPDPVVFLEPLRGYRAGRQDVPDGHYTVPLGKATIAREGTDITIVAWSAMVATALEAADLLAEEGISAEIIDLRTLSPFDSETIIHSVEKTGRAIVVHEAPKSAGVGAEIVATINEKALFWLEAPVMRVTGYDVVSPVILEDYHVPSATRIIQAARASMTV